MLLCSGKLRLGVIQQLFGLSLVEMLHGRLNSGHAVLLCSATSTCNKSSESRQLGTGTLRLRPDGKLTPSLGNLVT